MLLSILNVIKAKYLTEGFIKKGNKKGWKFELMI